MRQQIQSNKGFFSGIPLTYSVVACASILLLIWGLPDTIALRNICLILGAVLSSIYLFRSREIFFQKSAIPLGILFLLLVWVVIHACFFVNDTVQQFSELQSTWFRSACAMLLACATCLAIRERSWIMTIFPVAFFGMSLTVVSMYGFQSVLHGHFLEPNQFLTTYLFGGSKAGPAFFSIIDIAVGCAYLMYIFVSPSAKVSYMKLVAVLLLIATSLTASLVVNSKNGIGIGAILIFIFLGIISYQVLRNKAMKNRSWGIGLIAFFVIFLGSEIHLHREHASAGWNTLFSDIWISIHVDEYSQWRFRNQVTPAPLPLNSANIPVAGNTYERFSWMAEGLRLIPKHPLGYGTINKASFVGWLNSDGIENNLVNSTHSGWVDLGLAFGFPALLCTLIPIFAVLIMGIYRPDYSLWRLMSFWICLAILPAGLLQEITFKHTFEALLFLIAFSATSLIPNKKMT
jgi:hypothetical protein